MLIYLSYITNVQLKHTIPNIKIENELRKHLTKGVFILHRR